MQKIVQSFKKILSVAFSAIFLIQFNGIAQESLDLSSPIKADKDVKIGVLDNGLTYIIKKNEKPEKKGEFRLVVKAGSNQEVRNQSGLAHFLEHMAFNGSEHFDENGVVDYLQSIGVQFGHDLNAYTTFDKTVYILPIPLDNAEKLDQGLNILEDWAHGLTLSGEEIDKERGVIMEEWRMNKGAQQRLRDKALPILLQGSRFAERLPIGDTAVILNCEYERIRTFYKDWYRPNLMALIAVGDFDVDEMEKTIQERFGDIQNPENEKELISYTIPDHENTVIETFSDAELTTSSLQLYWKYPKKDMKTLQDKKDEFVVSLFNQMINQRLYELSTKPESPFLGVNVGVSDFIGDKSSYYLSITPKANQMEASYRLALDEIYKAAQNGFSESELKIAKANLEQAYEGAYQERSKMKSGDIANAYINNYFEGITISNIEHTYELLKAVLPTITVEDIHQVAKIPYQKNNRVGVVYTPEKEDLVIPSNEELMKILNEISSKQYEDENKDEELPELFTKELTPVAVKQEVRNEDLDLTTWLLPNGIKVTLKSTDYQNDQVIMKAFRFGGVSQAEDLIYQSASRAAQLVEMGGLADFDEIMLGKMLAGKKVNVSPRISELEEGFTGYAAPKDLEIMFQLIHLYATAPRKDAERTEAYVSKVKDYIKNALDDPNTYFRNEIYKTINNDHIRSQVTPTEEELDAIDINTAYSFYQSRFADMSGMHFYFVGNFEQEQIKPLIEKYLGSLKGKSANPHLYIDREVYYQKGLITKEIKKQSEPKASVFMFQHAKFKRSAKNYLASNFIGEILGLRLIETLREEEGGVYSPSAGSSNSLHPKATFTMQVYFDCDPEKRERLIEITKEEIEKLKTSIKEEDLNKVKRAWSENHKEQLKTNGYWVSLLYLLDSRDAPYEEITNLEKTLDAIQVKDVQKLAKKYFKGKDEIIMSLVPKE